MTTFCDKHAYIRNAEQQKDGHGNVLSYKWMHVIQP